jgi:hypothetical protein
MLAVVLGVIVLGGCVAQGPGVTGAPLERARDVVVTPIPSAGPPATPSPVAVPNGDLNPGMVEPEPGPAAVEIDQPSNPASRHPKRARMSVDLYHPGDFVGQHTFEWCVGASLQMTLNIATDRDTDSRTRQKRLWRMAQARSNSPYGGANPVGWTAALNDLGVGPYVLVSVPDFDDAVRLAARAIRQTKRPVGLVMWAGRHAWVMTGFESRGDPLKRDDARITAVRVLDPLYPYGSKVWGRSPRPNALIAPRTLAKQFVIREYGRSNLGVPPGHLLILPTVARG